MVQDSEVRLRIISNADETEWKLYYVCNGKKWWTGIHGATFQECIQAMQKMSAPSPEMLAKALEQNGTTYP